MTEVAVAVVVGLGSEEGEEKVMDSRWQVWRKESRKKWHLGGALKTAEKAAGRSRSMAVEAGV